MWILNKKINFEELLIKSEDFINSSLSFSFDEINKLSKQTTVPIAILEYGWKNCGKKFPREKYSLSAIDYNNLTDFNDLFSDDKLLIFWHANDIITHLELYNLDLELLKEDYDFIKDKIQKGEAHLIAEGDTNYLAAGLTEGKSSQPYNEKLARNREFVLKRKYLQHILDEIE